MPPASSPGLHDRHSGSSRRATDRAAKVRFRRAITLMVMTLFLPGSAQLVAGRRDIGTIALRIFAGLVGVVAFVLLLGTMWHGFIFWIVSNTLMLNLIRFTMMLVAIAWAGLFIDAWRIGAPLTLLRNQRLAVVGVNGALCFSVAGTLLFGAHLVTAQKDLMDMFGDGPTSAATDGRYNVLLMGGDSGADRWGLRPDSMTVASIDEDTGKTVLIGLPRNLQNFTFRPGSTMDKQFPDGFDCDGCYINGVSTWAQDHEDLFPKAKNPGTTATIQAIEGVTGLKINYWAMVNLAGFEKLVDAVGGVELNVRDRIPVGGLGDDVTGYVEPGTRTLNGHDALWFARSREGSDDYSRMARQKCVMNAMATQIEPKTLLTHYEEITSAGKAMVETDLPSNEFPRFLDLALKAKGQPMSTVSIVPPAINTADPDMEKIQSMISNAIDKAEGKSGEDSADDSGGDSGAEPKKKAKKSGSTTTVNGGSLGTRDDGYVANESEDLAAAC